jgi:phage terminase large subunit-like protein
VLSAAYDPQYAWDLVAKCQQNYFGLMQSFGQTMMNVCYPTRFLEETCYEASDSDSIKGFEFFNNPVLAWMVNNVEIRRDNNGNIRAVKLDPRRKIDGIAALINALAAYLSYEENPGGTIDFISYGDSGG